MTQIIPPKPASITPSLGYQRVDVESLEHHVLPDQPLIPPPTARGGLRWLIIPLSMLLCAGQTIITVIASAGGHELLLDVIMIPVLAFALLLVVALIVNPCLRLTRTILGDWAGPLNRRELVCVFTAMMVSAGVNYGLACPLLPMIAGPNNHAPKFNTPASGWDEALVPSLNKKLYLQDQHTITDFELGITLKNADGKPVLHPRDTAVWREKLTYDWKVFNAIQWKSWLVPVGYWMVFIGACYGIFYSLSYIVLSYWSNREKLIFPLVRLYESLLPLPGQGRYRLPPVLTNPGFWAGFALTFVIWAWNANVLFGHLANKGFFPLPMGMEPPSVAEKLKDSIFQGLSVGGGDANLRFLIIFTAIGVAFLLPLEISFSVWLYFILGRIVLLVMMWSGFGENMASFPSTVLDTTNPLTALGGGGMFLFSGVCLFRCVSDYWRRLAHQSLGRRALIALPVVGLLVCTALLVAWLNWNHLPVGWGLVFAACMILLTLGLMRIVAEAGIYWFQTHTGFFHFFRIFGLGKYLAPSLLAPILPIYATLFMDTKSFIAPNMLNAAEMEKANRVGHLKFQLNVVICLVLSVAVALGLSLFLAHLWGANSMEGWFYVENPPWVLNAAQKLLTDQPRFDMGETLWFVGGAGWVLLSIFLRTTLFWFPHPIGLIMLINPMMSQLWFSFFIGWICKKLVVRYGGKATYDRVRGIFIGLIAGELVAVLFWVGMALFTGMAVKQQLNNSPGPSLNRYY